MAEEPPPGIRSVVVAPFEAWIPEPEMGALVAEALRREVASGTALVLATGDADAVISGTIESADDDPSAFRTKSGGPVAAAWTVRVRASLVVLPADGGAPRKVGPVVVEASRIAGATDARDLASRERAMRAIAGEIGRALYRALVAPGTDDGA